MTTPVPAAAATNDEDAGRLVGAPRSRLIAILVALVLFTEFVPLQYTLVGVLIPKIGLAFPAAGANVTWALTIIGVVGAAILALAGKTSDLWGKKRTLLVLGGIFLAGTLVCAVTSSWPVFLAGRALQAFSFCIPAVAYGLIRDLLPRRWIPVAMGLVATGLGASSVLAPLVGGLLTDHYSWRSVFWFLVIYALIISPLMAFIVPESPYRVRQRFDWLGAILFGAGIAGVLIYVSEGTSWGWGSANNLGYLIGGLVLLAAFVATEARISFPMMELSLLRSPAVAIVMAVGVFATLCAALPNYTISYIAETPKPASVRAQVLAGISAKEHVPVSIIEHFVVFRGNIGYAEGFSVFQLAWHITIFTAASGMIFGPIGGMIARRHGARLPLIIGALAFVATFGLWTLFHDSWQDQASIGLLWGLGFGFFYAAGPNLLIDAIPARQQGISAAMYAVFGAIGSALATALITPILAAHPFQLIATPPGGKPVVSDIPQVYTDTGYAQSYLLVGGLAALVTVVLAVALRAGRTPARGGIVEISPIPGATAQETPPEPAAPAHPGS